MPRSALGAFDRLRPGASSPLPGPLATRERTGPALHELIAPSLRAGARNATPIIFSLALAACSTSTVPGGQGPPEPPPTDTAVGYVPGESYLGTDGYVEYIAGDLPIILSAPHGGDITPSAIPDRTDERCGGSATTVTDMNTRELVLAMREAMLERFGGQPHVVISHLHRRKLDPNRDLDEAACGDLRAERAWTEFQQFLEDATDLAVEVHGRAWYMDMHGHGHEVQRLELGYLLAASVFASPDSILTDDSTAIRRSSVRSIAEDGGIDFSELLRGPASLGALYQAQGFPAVPSPDSPSPDGAPYFTGGYNTARHTCGSASSEHGGVAGGPLCGVQIEANRIGVRDSEESRAAFAEATAAVLEQYLTTHWGLPVQPATP